MQIEQQGFSVENKQTYIDYLTSLINAAETAVRAGQFEVAETNFLESYDYYNKIRRNIGNFTIPSPLVERTIALAPRIQEGMTELLLKRVEIALNNNDLDYAEQTLAQLNSRIKAISNQRNYQLSAEVLNRIQDATNRIATLHDQKADQLGQTSSPQPINTVISTQERVIPPENNSLKNMIAVISNLVSRGNVIISAHLSDSTLVHLTQEEVIEIQEILNQANPIILDGDLLILQLAAPAEIAQLQTALNALKNRTERIQNILNKRVVKQGRDGMEAGRDRNFLIERERLIKILDDYKLVVAEAQVQLQNDPYAVFDPRIESKDTGEPPLVTVNQAANDFDEVSQNLPPSERRDQRRIYLVPARNFIQDMWSLVRDIDSKRYTLWKEAKLNPEFKTFLQTIFPIIDGLLDTRRQTEWLNAVNTGSIDQLEDFLLNIGENLSFDQVNSLLAESRSFNERLIAMSDALPTEYASMYPGVLQQEFNSRQTFAIDYLTNDQKSKIRSTSESIKVFISKLETRVSFLTGEIAFDPRRMWTTFGQSRKLWGPESDGRAPEDVRKLEIHIFNTLLGNALNYLWNNPLDHGKAGEAKIRNWPIPYGERTVTYSELIESHPDNPPGSARLFKEQVDLLARVLSGATNWADVIKAQGPFEKVEEFFKANVFEGEHWHAMSELPALGFRNKFDREHQDEEPGLGELSFEALSFYERWNSKYVFATDSEIANIRTKVLADIGAKKIKIPPESDMKNLVTQQDQVRFQNSIRRLAIIPRNYVETSIDLGTSDWVQNIVPIELVIMYRYAAKQNYDQFKKILIDAIVEEGILNDVEKNKQKKFGMFPISEFGLENKNFEHMRAEVAIRIGCYCLGIGEYEPNINGLNAGKLVGEYVSDNHPSSNHHNGYSPRKNNVVRDLTEVERQQALEAGKAAELIGFDAYIANLGPLSDDNILTKSEIVSTRLMLTAKYRNNYKTYPRAGVYVEGFATVRQLLPKYFTFLGLNNMSIAKMVSDRTHRKHANWMDVGSRERGKLKDYVEIFEFAKEIYPVLSGGIATVLGADIFKIASFETPKSLFAAAIELQPNTDMIKKLIDYSDQKLGYWLDRMVATKRDVDSQNSVYDPNIWREIVSPLDPNVKTGICSPCVLMFNLPPETMHKIALEIAKSEKKNNVYRVEFRKIIISIAMIESLRRTNKTEIRLEDYVALRYILTGHIDRWAAFKYNIRNATQLIPREADAFRFTQEEFDHIIRESGLVLQHELVAAMQEIGGVPG